MSFVGVHRSSVQGAVKRCGGVNPNWLDTEDKMRHKCCLLVKLLALTGALWMGVMMSGNMFSAEPYNCCCTEGGPPCVARTCFSGFECELEHGGPGWPYDWCCANCCIYDLE